MAAIPAMSSFGPKDFDAVEFGRSLNAWCEPLRFECSPPFAVGWYNKMRDEKASGMNKLEVPDDAVAYALATIPGYIDVVVEHYARCKPSEPVDSATNEIVQWLKDAVPAELDAFVCNTDKGPPYFHVQTMGAVAGYDEHIEAEEVDDKEWKEDLEDILEDTRDPKMWGTNKADRRKIFGVNHHPVWGGWYAYRILVVLKNVTAGSTLQRPELRKFQTLEEKKRILYEFNKKHDECVWRDLKNDGSHPADKKYLPEEFFFFTETKPDKRKRFLQMRVDQMKETPKPRVQASSGGYKTG
eukprot:TRINITY_DN8095_c0_g1_i1.p1 TRINITY_DN8095_c0_g1~~TRINITY_DN8095_c0_g1_i1.p1  ORF type:complete len:327 (+),score=77.34 TRINITY_DN8095_c0_g1_i1:88-981(+)